MGLSENEGIHEGQQPSILTLDVRALLGGYRRPNDWDGFLK
jgi:hypothetical protein